MDGMPQVCALCCNTVSKSNLEGVVEVSGKILNVLLLRQQDINKETPVVCRYCSDKVKVLFEFKSACLDTDDFITPFVDHEGTDKVDLKELFMREKAHGIAADTFCNWNLCRLCLEFIVVGGVRLDERDSHVNFVRNLIQRCIPEVNVDNSKDTVVCDACLNSLNEYSDFLDYCTSDKKIKHHCLQVGGDETYQTTSAMRVLKESNNLKLNDNVEDTDTITREENASRIKYEEIEVKPFDCWKSEDQEDFNGNRYPIMCQNESIRDDKSEIKLDNLNPIESTVNNQLENGLSVIKSPAEEHKNDLINNYCERELYKSDFSYCESKQKRNTTLPKVQKYDPRVKVLRCDLCDYKAEQKGCLRKHMLAHKDPSDVKCFKCDMCDYKSKRKSSFKKHTLIHKSPSDVEWLKCHLCDYKSNQTSNLNRHMLIHKGPSEGEWFKCDSCDYKSKVKNSLKRHTLIHKGPSEGVWFKCGICDFKSRYRTCLKAHMLVHKDPSEVDWFKCDLCDYKAKEKGNLRRHESVHIGPFEIPLVKNRFKCCLCDYKSNGKRLLKSHMLVHKDPSEVQWFKCDACDFKSKRRSSLKSHVLVHKNPSDVHLFRCHICNFKTKRKDCLASHALIHQTPSEIEWFECDICGHKSKQKRGLKYHMLVHKDPSEVEWFRCDLCNFRTKYKTSLKTHNMLVHKLPSEIEWFKCDLCDFNAKRKGDLVKHALIHQGPSSSDSNTHQINLKEVEKNILGKKASLSEAKFPPDTLIGGIDVDGDLIYVGKARYKDDWLPAKVVAGKLKAYVSYGGKEIALNKCKLLCGLQCYTWVKSSFGSVPTGAVEGGITSTGERLFIGRARHAGSISVGKIHPSHGVLYIPFGGKEISYHYYEVLTEMLVCMSYRNYKRSDKITDRSVAELLLFGLILFRKVLKMAGFTAQYTWVNAYAHGAVPHNALYAGVDSDGHHIYVGKAFHNGDWIPAKVIPGKQACYVPYNGTEVFVENFQVLCGPAHSFDWVHSSGGHIPPGAVEGGITSQGERLYIGRANHQGSTTVGKVHPSHRVLYIPFGGQEVPHSSYEILVTRSHHHGPPPPFPHQPHHPHQPPHNPHFPHHPRW
ncbi:hypothetical protein NQ315_007422 [Exocentrus adspersus]|uniref:C2H2-type domain-containing protein n=1 Tax=Exocentrus adspersus TaxID=1586481 RepID=A0AAV8VHZ8_9CUCU|nr:hypothetical protein NQ315_007422 [Exocentrus adspersus]